MPPPASTPAYPARRRRLPTARAMLLWAAYSVAFMLGGGIGAGVPAGLFLLTTGNSYDATLYAITFGVTGFIAYRLAQRVAEG